jgi:hypothetical protein
MSVRRTWDGNWRNSAFLAGCRQSTEKDKIMEVKAYNSYLETLGLLNESMDLDLR